MLSIKFGVSVGLSGRSAIMAADWFDRLAERAEASMAQQAQEQDHGKLRIQQIRAQGPQLLENIFADIEGTAQRFNARFPSESRKIALISKDPNGSAITCERTHYPAVTLRLEANLQAASFIGKIATRPHSGSIPREKTLRFRFEIDKDGDVYVVGDSGGRMTNAQIAEACLTPFFTLGS